LPNQNVDIDAVTGLMINRMTRPKPGTYVDFRIEMDSVVGISSCPDLWAGGSQGIDVQVFKGGLV